MEFKSSKEISTRLKMSPRCGPERRNFITWTCRQTAFRSNLGVFFLWSPHMCSIGKLCTRSLHEATKSPVKWQLLCWVQLFATPWTVVHGILQARILEWVAFPFSRGIFPSQGSNPGLPHCRRILYQLSHQESPWKPRVTSKAAVWLKTFLAGVWDTYLSPSPSVTASRPAGLCQHDWSRRGHSSVGKE